MANTAKVAFQPTSAKVAYANVLISQLDGLVSQRKQWEATDYKKANEGLYSLLASCLEVFKSKFVDADDSYKKTLRSKDLFLRKNVENPKVLYKLD